MKRLFVALVLFGFSVVFAQVRFTAMRGFPDSINKCSDETILRLEGNGTKLPSGIFASFNMVNFGASGTWTFKPWCDKGEGIFYKELKPFVFKIGDVKRVKIGYGVSFPIDGPGGYFPDAYFETIATIGLKTYPGYSIQGSIWSFYLDDAKSTALKFSKRRFGTDSVISSYFVIIELKNGKKAAAELDIQ